MPPSRRPTVVLWSAPGTLGGIDRWLERDGVRLVRLSSVAPRPVNPRPWLARIARAPPPDTVVVTSRAAVEAGIRRWRHAAGRLPPGLEFWAVGPGTAAAVRAAGIRRVRRPWTLGSDAIGRALARETPRRIVYFRSDRAGPTLARSLRQAGHAVLDLTVYRLGPSRRLTARARRDLREAQVLVVTSPSGLRELRRRLGRLAFSRVSRSATLVVLGERSRRSARRFGFRRTSVAPATAPYRFSRHLLRELDDARR